MAIVAADVATSAKNRLGISDTTFDTLLAGFVTDNVKRLYPRLQLETAVQEAIVSPSHGEAHVDLTTLATPLAGVRRVELMGDSGAYDCDDVYQHLSDLRLRGLPNCSLMVFLYGLLRPTLATLTDEYFMVLVYYVMADFFRYLLGDKRKYNEYMNNGAPAVDELADLANYWENAAENELDKAAPRYGHQ